MIMGATLARRIGEQSASKLMRSIKPGCIIDCVGRPAEAAAVAAAAPRAAAAPAPAAVAEFAAVSVSVVLTGAMSRRSEGMPLQTLAGLSNPLVAAGDAAGSGRGFPALARRPARVAGKGKERLEVYRCPLAEQDIVLVQLSMPWSCDTLATSSTASHACNACVRTWAKIHACMHCVVDHQPWKPCRSCMNLMHAPSHGHWENACSTVFDEPRGFLGAGGSRRHVFLQVDSGEGVRGVLAELRAAAGAVSRRSSYYEAVPIGLDAEWEPHGRGEAATPVATLQIATRSRAWVLDMQALCRSVRKNRRDRPGAPPAALRCVLACRMQR